MVDFMQLVTTQGVWAALTIALIFYIIRTQDKRDSKQEERENRYQKIILNLSEELNTVKDIGDEVLEIKSTIERFP